MRPEIIVRSALPADDPVEIAGLIMLTDPFIYPVGFGREGIPALADMIRNESTVFGYGNISIALQGNRMAGQAAAISDAGTSPIDPKTYLRAYPCLPEAFADVAVRYINHLQDYISGPDEIYIPCVSVLPDMRGRGVGSMLIEHIIRKYPRKRLKLHVLADNRPAIALYERYGFRITGNAEQGYAYHETPPLCYEMCREAD